MAIEIKVPDIGADEVEITEILVKVGDKVEAEQSLITVEGDKASMEVPAPFAGVVKELKVNVGDKVKTGSLIMIFEFRRRCSRRCTCSGRREERSRSGSSTSGCSGKRR